MQILIPMAGEGKRFLDMGYKTSKPAILTFERRTGTLKPMVVCAVSDLPGVEEDGKNVVFIDRMFHQRDGVEDAIQRYYPKAKFIRVDELTEGQACTCLLAEETLDEEQELLIAGCDNGMVCDRDLLNTLKYQSDILVFTYRHNEAVLKNPNAYGWMITDNQNNIVDVSIKKAISNNPMNDHAVVATFWFKKAKIFFESARKMIGENDRINNEFYVDQAIKHALELGYKAKVFEIDRYICWGTPEDYEEYQRTYEYWKNFLRQIDSAKVNVPFSIGIAGDSGTGKTTLLTIFKKILGENDILVLEGDGEHKWERQNPAWNFFTHLNPDANNIYRQADNLQMLKKGAAIVRHDYDHNSGTFTDDQRYMPKDYIILCGLHSFYLEQNRRNLDLKIYMDVEENLRRYWKINRDVVERGYDIETVIDLIDERTQDALSYVIPQRESADVKIHYYDPFMTDYKDLLHEEVVYVDIMFNNRFSQEILLPLWNMLEKIEGIEINEDKICFQERTIADKRIPIENIEFMDKSIGRNTGDCYYGKSGVLALVFMYLIDRIKADEI